MHAFVIYHQVIVISPHQQNGLEYFIPKIAGEIDESEVRVQAESLAHGLKVCLQVYSFSYFRLETYIWQETTRFEHDARLY